jgi:PAS domain S-box-containing protein
MTPDPAPERDVAPPSSPHVQFAFVTRDYDARAVGPRRPRKRDDGDNLALALEAGHVGTWTWDMASGHTVWDAEIEALHGMAPGTFGGAFEDWCRSLHPEDRDECLARVRHALRDRSPYVLLHRTIWPDGSVHWIECRGIVLVDDAGDPTGTTGVAFDVTSHKTREAVDAERLARRQRLVDTLQVALLPDDPPQVVGITFATRYVSARGPGEVGGDWYSIVPLDGKRLGVAVGDVAGHGLAAVAEMAAARFGLRALAVVDPAPDRVLELMNQHVRLFERDTMITALYGILDPAARTWTYANAGHCPPILRGADGAVEALAGAREPPLGYGESYQTSEHELSQRGTVVLYTDGLIERRGEDISLGIARLVEACATGPDDPEALADHLLAELLTDAPNDDDIAIVVLTID